MLWRVFSLLLPPIPVSRQTLTLAQKAFNQWHHGKPFHGYLKDVQRNLERVVKGERLKGDKISAFHDALLGDESALVIDRWIFRVYGTKNRERIVSLMTVEATARKMTITAYQAEVWKEAKRLGRKGGTSRSFGSLLKEKGHQLTLF